MCARCIHTNLRNGLARVRESRYVAVTRQLLRHFLNASMGCQQGLGATNLGLDNFEARFVSNILPTCGMYISCGTWQQFCAARHFATNRTAVRWRCVWTLGLSSPRAKGANFGLDLQGCRGLFLGDQSEGVLSITTSVSRALTLSVDLFIWQIMLVPERVENPASAGEADAEYPCEVPHRLALNRDWPNSFPRSLPSLRRAAPGTRSKCKSARSGGRSASPAT